jgi:methylglutaconyl-CoA hydratase
MSVLATLDQGVLTLTLSRPDKRNAIDSAMVEGLHRELARADLDAGVRVVLLRGAGKDFCAGADLDELLASADRPPDENERSALRLGEVFIRIRRLTKPVVCLVHGRALAGGAGLATSCDLVLAAETARLGYPEILRGFVPAMVMAILRRQVGERLAFDLVATGRLLSAQEACAAGLVSRVYADGALETAATGLVRQLSGSSPSALALIKRLLYELDDQSFHEGIALGARVNALARQHPDFRTAISAFLKP